MRFTPDNITVLLNDEVFCFGSNELGSHGAGAAKTARCFGAVWGVGFGPKGRTFAIPTKDWNIKTLPLKEIGFYVTRFIEYAKNRSYHKFLVTKIGMGLAGYSLEEIAPLFKCAIGVENIILPKEIYEHIIKS